MKNYEERNMPDLKQYPGIEKGNTFSAPGTSESTIVGVSHGNEGAPRNPEGGEVKNYPAIENGGKFSVPGTSEPRDPQPVVSNFRSGERGARMANSPNSEFLKNYPPMERDKDLHTETVPAYQVTMANCYESGQADYLGHFNSESVFAEGHNPGKKKGKVHKVMHEFKHGTLHSGSKKGPKVKSRKQAVAIALSEARKHGEDV